jgi:hypothetical protein
VLVHTDIANPHLVTRRHHGAKERLHRAYVGQLITAVAIN